MDYILIVREIMQNKYICFSMNLLRLFLPENSYQKSSSMKDHFYHNLIFTVYCIWNLFDVLLQKKTLLIQIVINSYSQFSTDSLSINESSTRKNANEKMRLMKVMF